MRALLELLVDRGDALVLSLTAVLALGAAAVLALRAPVHRQRTAEATVAAACVALVLVLLPLPGPLGRWAGALDGTGPGAETWEAPAELLDEPGAAAPAAERPAPLASATAAGGAGDPSAAVWLAGVLTLGAAVVALVLSSAAWHLGRIRRSGEDAPPWIVALARREGARGVRIVVSRSAARPFCFDARRPCVVLPRALAREDRADRLRVVLQHELAHVRLGHLRSRALVSAAAALLYWHPLFWWLAHEQRCAAELLADDRAAARVGKRAYVRALVSVAEEAAATRALHPLHAPLGATDRRPSAFYRRMRTLLMRTHRLDTRSSRAHVVARGLAAAALLAAVTVAWGRPAGAQEASGTTSPRAGVVASSADRGGDAKVVRIRTRGDADLGHALFELADSGHRVLRLDFGDRRDDGVRFVEAIVVPPRAHDRVGGSAGVDEFFVGRRGGPEDAPAAGSASGGRPGGAGGFGSVPAATSARSSDFFLGRGERPAGAPGIGGASGGRINAAEGRSGAAGPTGSRGTNELLLELVEQNRAMRESLRSLGEEVQELRERVDAKEEAEGGTIDALLETTDRRER